MLEKVDLPGRGFIFSFFSFIFNFSQLLYLNNLCLNNKLPIFLGEALPLFKVFILNLFKIISRTNNMSANRKPSGTRKSVGPVSKSARRAEEKRLALAGAQAELSRQQELVGDGSSSESPSPSEVENEVLASRGMEPLPGPPPRVTTPSQPAAPSRQPASVSHEPPCSSTHASPSEYYQYEAYPNYVSGPGWPPSGSAAGPNELADELRKVAAGNASPPRQPVYPPCSPLVLTEESQPRMQPRGLRDPSLSGRRNELIRTEAFGKIYGGSIQLLQEYGFWDRPELLIHLTPEELTRSTGIQISDAVAAIAHRRTLLKAHEEILRGLDDHLSPHATPEKRVSLQGRTASPSPKRANIAAGRGSLEEEEFLPAAASKSSGKRMARPDYLPYMSEKALRENPGAVLQDFEGLLGFMSVPLTEYPAHFIMMVDPQAADEHPAKVWKQAVIRDGVLDWTAMKEHFLMHFNIQLTACELIEDLVKFSYHVGDTVGTALARYRALCGRYGYRGDRSAAMPFHGPFFLRGMPAALQSEYHRKGTGIQVEFEQPLHFIAEELTACERAMKASGFDPFLDPPGSANPGRLTATGRSGQPSRQSPGRPAWEPRQSGIPLPARNITTAHSTKPPYVNSHALAYPTPQWYCPLHPTEQHSLNRCPAWRALLATLKPMEPLYEYSISQLKDYVRAHGVCPALADRTIFRPRQGLTPAQARQAGEQSGTAARAQWSDTAPAQPVSNRGEPTCYRCQRTGHIATNCPSAAPSAPGAPRIDPTRRVKRIIYSSDENNQILIIFPISIF